MSLGVILLHIKLHISLMVNKMSQDTGSWIIPRASSIQRSVLFVTFYLQHNPTTNTSVVDTKCDGLRHTKAGCQRR